MEPVLTTAEIAERLKISEWWIREQCKSGDLPAHKLAGKWRVKESDFEAWFEDKLHVPARTPSFEPPPRKSASSSRITLADIREASKPGRSEREC